MFAFKWLYDEMFEKKGENSYRSVFMSEIDQTLVKIDKYDKNLARCLDNINNCEQVIVKRLQWNAGTVPSMHETIKQFELKRKKRNDYFKVIDS